MRLNPIKKATIILCMMAGFLWASTALAKVTGTIKQAGDKVVTIIVTVSKPAPATAIVTVDIPNGTNITDSKPKFSRWISDKNQAQWLLKDIKPGDTEIAIYFDKNTGVQDLKALIRYKDSATGSMVELPVK